MTKPNLNYNLVLFIVFFLIVILSKLSILSTPYYWDEIGWIRSAHWLSDKNLLKAIPGFHPPATFFGHPPGLHVSMAFLFKLFGESIWLSHLFIVCFSFIGIYFTYLLGSYLFGRLTGIFSALFLFFTPMYFAQSGMYLGDIPVTAIGIMSIYFGLKRKYFSYIASSIYLVLLKETGAAIVLAFLIYLLISEFKKAKSIYIEVLKYSIPLLLFTGFMVLQKFTSGKFFGIYSFEFDVYKYTAEAIFTDFISIIKWIFLYQYRFIFLIIIISGFIFNRKIFFRKEMLLFGSIVFLIVLIFSCFYFLPRYILPSLPYLYIMAAWVLTELIKSIKLQVMVSLILIILSVSSLSGSTSYGNNEWNMKYVNHVNMYRSMCNYIERKFPNSSILTIFPFNTSLKQPYLGYVSKPLHSISFDKSIDEGEYDLILFSDPSVEERELRLKGYVKKNGMILVKKVEGEGVISKLYAKNSLMQIANKINGK